MRLISLLRCFRTFFFSCGSCEWRPQAPSWLPNCWQAGFASVHVHKDNSYCNIIVWLEQIVHLAAPVPTDRGPKLEPYSSPWLPPLQTDRQFRRRGLFFYLRLSDQRREQATEHFFFLALKLSDFWQQCTPINWPTKTGAHIVMVDVP